MIKQPVSLWGASLRTHLGQLLTGLAILAGAAACTPAGDIAAGVPSADANSGAYLLDTITVRMSTVFQDSVNTSTPAYMLTGRYIDPQIGTVSATSFFRLGLSSVYQPSTTEVFDSLTLVLKVDAFRYGDTTRTQTIEVHRVNTQLVDNQIYFAFDQLPYDAAVLNQGTLANQPFHARPNQSYFRFRLADTFGQELLAAGRQGAVTNDLDLSALVAGLALVPGASDNAALLRFVISDASAALNLYTHEPNDPTTPLIQSFPLSYSTKHFYHITADRTGTLLAPLVTRLQALDVSNTAQQVYIDGAVGLEAKIEFPYLTDVREFGGNLTLTSARFSLETVPSASVRYLTPPTGLTAYLSSPYNKRVGTLSASIPYQGWESPRTAVQTTGYIVDLAGYCQAVLDHKLDNNGIILASAVPESPERVVLGGPKLSEYSSLFKLYFVQ